MEATYLMFIASSKQMKHMKTLLRRLANPRPVLQMQVSAHVGDVELEACLNSCVLVAVPAADPCLPTTCL
jgi:hypothetical protein